MRSLLPIGALILLIATLACTDTIESGSGGTTGTTTSGGGTTNTGGAGGTGGATTTSGGGSGGAGGGGGVFAAEAISLLYSQFPSSSGTSTSSSGSSSSSSSTSTSTSSTSTGSSSTSTSTSSTSTSTSSTSTSTSTTSTSTSTTSTSTTTSTGGIDPDTLYIMLSNMTLACNDPYESACGQWRVSVGIPPSLQQPGQIALSNPELNTYYSVMDQSCTGSSGGSFTQGTLELVSVTSQAVTGVFSDTSDFQVDVNGAFSAPRCP